jgi:hypothetical protein
VDGVTVGPDPKLKPPKVVVTGVVDAGVVLAAVGKGSGVASDGVGNEVARVTEESHADAAAASEVETDSTVVVYIVEDNTSLTSRVMS